MQYIFVRTKSVLLNAGFEPDFDNLDVSKFLDNEAISVLKNIYEFEDVLINVTQKNEPYLLSRYLIELAKNYSLFYNTHKILVEDTSIANARVCLTYMTNIVLENGAKLLGINMPEKM